MPVIFMKCENESQAGLKTSLKVGYAPEKFGKFDSNQSRYFRIFCQGALVIFANRMFFFPTKGKRNFHCNIISFFDSIFFLENVKLQVNRFLRCYTNTSRIQWFTCMRERSHHDKKGVNEYIF